MGDEMPTTEALETAWADRADFLRYVKAGARSDGDEARYREQFRTWLAQHDAEVAIEGARRAAEYLRNEAEEPWGFRLANMIESEHAAAHIMGES